MRVECTSCSVTLGIAGAYSSLDKLTISFIARVIVRDASGRARRAGRRETEGAG